MMPLILVIFATLLTSAKFHPVGDFSGSARLDLGVGEISNTGGVNAVTAIGFLQKRTDPLAVFLPERPKGREEAVLDKPSLIQQADAVYDSAQKAIIDFLHPKPIVDTISEQEKYGNNGDQFRSLGNAIVGGYEGFSNFINAAADLPFEAMKQVTRKATSYLSTIGAKIVGL